MAATLFLEFLETILEISYTEGMSQRKPEDRVTPLPVATMEDVARRAGVAISSVSRVLSGHPDVSARMAKKVEEATRLLGYEPDILAQSMRSGESRTIGFIITDISNPLFAQVAQSCEQELRKMGYSMILMSSDGDDITESENFAVLRRRRVDGIIASLVSEKSSTVKSSLQSLRSPLVLLDRQVAGYEYGSVSANHFAGTRDAVNHLINQGHREIAFVTGTPDVLITRERLKGYKKAFAENNLPINENNIRLGNFTEEFSERQTYLLFSSPTVPTAILTGGVGATAGAIRALRSLSLTIGTDVSFVAIDEWPMFDVILPQLSSVYRDAEMLGRESARLLLEIMRGAKPRKTVIDTHFIIRESSANRARNKKKI